MGKNSRRQQKPVTVSVYSVKEKALIAAGAMGVALAVYGMFRAASPAVSSPPAVVAKDETRFDALDNQAILDRFVALPKERQRDLFERICAEADRESGMGPVYDSIFQKVNPRVLTLDELGALLPVEPSMKESYARMKEHPKLTIYSGVIDAIITSEPNYQAEFVSILEHKVTSKAILAHESLHNVQNRASIRGRIAQALRRGGYIREGGVIDMANLSMPYAVVPLVKAVVGDETLPDARVSSLIGESLTYMFERGLLHETAARWLVPMVQMQGEYASFRFAPAFIDQYQGSNVDVAAPLIARVYGKCLAEGDVDIDIRVNQAVGSHDTIRELEQYLGSTSQEQLRRGLLYLKARSDRLQAVPRAARRVLARELD